MSGHHSQELEVAVATVDEAVAVTHGAVMRLPWQQLLLAGIGEHGGLTLKEVHYLAVGVVAVIAYRGAGCERAQHDFVVLVNQPARHILSLATLEIGSNIEFQIFKINFHSCN